MALPVSVKCFARARSMAEISRKISSGPAPTQSGGCFHQEREVVGISDTVVKNDGRFGSDLGADSRTFVVPAGNIDGG
jgi:hypothetical protein